MSDMNSNAIVPSEWTLMQQQASTLVASGFLPKAIDTPQKAVAIIMLGRELGIAPWAALGTINVIQGKPAASPQLMLALINRSGQLEDMRIDDDGQTCTVMMKRKGRTAHSESFSMDDARRMMTTEYVNGQKRSIPLADKYNWQQMPTVMRKWRAVAACARIVFADIILGLYTPDEMGADVSADEQGNMTVIDVRPEPAQQSGNGHISTDKPIALPTGAGVQPNRPTPPPTASTPPTTGTVEESANDLIDFGAEQGATTTVITQHPVAPDEDLDLYHCNRLKIHQTKTATQYILFVEKSATRITVTNLIVFEGLTLNGKPIIELPPGDYPLEPMWSVHADNNGRSWDTHSIETEMAF